MSVSTGALAPASAEGIDLVPRRSPLPGRTLALLVAIVLGFVGNMWYSLAAYHGDADIKLSWLTAHQSAWVAATYGTAVNALGVIAVLLAVCILVRGKGSAWATTALVVGAIGTVLYVVSTAVPMQMLGLGKQSVITPQQTSSLIDYLSKHDHIQGAVAFPGFLLLLVAQIAVFVALLRSRAVPLWVPIVFLVGGILDALFASGGAVTAICEIPQAVAMIALGWYAYRTSTRTA